MTIIPIHPDDVETLETTETSTVHARRTLGRQAPSRRTLGRKLPPSRRIL